MKTKIIKQTIVVKATPHEIYDILMDSKKHSQLIGDKASISTKVGGKFTVYGDYITGKNIELVQDKKIVQSWHANDWVEGHYSTVTFNLIKTKTGTKLDFTQTNVPDEHYKDIKQGWIDYYWQPLKDMLKK